MWTIDTFSSHCPRLSPSEGILNRVCADDEFRVGARGKGIAGGLDEGEGEGDEGRNGKEGGGERKHRACR